MKSAALTGANSMLGRQLVKKLEELGVSVISIGRSASDHIFLDFGQRNALPDLSEHRGIEFLFHCAASFSGDTPDGIQNNLAVNTEGAARICDLATQLGVRKIIYAGSLSSDALFDAGHLNTYGLSKKFAEELFSWWARRNATHFCSLRFTQLYDTQGHCIAHQPWFGRIVAYAARGLDLRLPTSLGPRNFLHAEDAADMMVHVTRHEVSGVLNATHPNSVTMDVLANIAYNIFDNGGQVLIAPEKAPFRHVNLPMANEIFKRLDMPSPRSIEQGFTEIRNAGTYTSFGPLDVS